MARVEIPIIVLDPDDGSLVENAEILIEDRVSNTESTVYSNESGAGEETQPLSSDVQGRVEGWLERGTYRATISITGHPDREEYFDVTPGADGSITTAWLGNLQVTTGKLANDSITRDKIADDAVGADQVEDGTLSAEKLASSAGITLTQLETLVQNALFKPGNLKLSATVTEEPGWLLCDGRAVSRATYAALWAKLSEGGTAPYGTGDGTVGSGTTFNLPDLRGRAPVGADNMGSGAAGRITSNNARGNTGGAQTHTLTTGQLASHLHPNNIDIVPNGGHAHQSAVAFGGPLNGQVFGYNLSSAVDGSGVPVLDSSGPPGGLVTSTEADHDHGINGGVQNAGGGEAHNNLQPYQVFYWLIKT
jgi:microcystin-dependent protein